jgi:excisionase family DNA binding protein
MNITTETRESLYEGIPSTQTEQVLTVADVQKILKISRAMSYALVNSGTFPIIRIGKAIRIPTRTFQEWLYSSNPAIIIIDPQKGGCCNEC